MRYLRSLLVFPLIALMLLFQNCSGGVDNGDGTSVGNPLDSDKTLKVGFSAFTQPASSVEVGLCIDKVIIRVIRFDEPQLLEPAVVGWVRDAESNAIGEVKAKIAYDGSTILYSVFEGEESRYVGLSSTSDVVVYELDIPNGRYAGIAFSSAINVTGGCETINNNSFQVNNGFGEFFSNIEYDVTNDEEFVVSDNNPVSKNIDSQQIVDDVKGVQSNSELEQIIRDNY